MTQSHGWDGILEQGETILWQGRPQSGIRWRDALGVQLVFGAGFAGFALFWMLAASAMVGQGGAPGVFVVFPLFGLPFLFAGLYVMFGHVVMDAYARSTAWYTLTDRSAFIATKAFGRKKLESYRIADMQILELEDGAPGSVIFAEIALDDRKNRVPRRIGFSQIPDARAVYRMMREARGALNSSDPQARD